MNKKLSYSLRIMHTIHKLASAAMVTNSLLEENQNYLYFYFPSIIIATNLNISSVMITAISYIFIPKALLLNRNLETQMRTIEDR